MEYNVGDKVVYPSQGVSIIESISDEELAGSKMKCYNLRLLSTDSKVVIPVANTTRVGLRPLSEGFSARRRGRRTGPGGRRRMFRFPEMHRPRCEPYYWLLSPEVCISAGFP